MSGVSRTGRDGKLMMMTVIGGGGLPPVHKRHQHSRRDFVQKRASLFQNFRHTKSPKKFKIRRNFFKKKGRLVRTVFLFSQFSFFFLYFGMCQNSRRRRESLNPRSTREQTRRWSLYICDY
jgi:hypothetical protein